MDNTTNQPNTPGTPLPTDSSTQSGQMPTTPASEPMPPTANEPTGGISFPTSEPTSIPVEPETTPEPSSPVNEQPVQSPTPTDPDLIGAESEPTPDTATSQPAPSVSPMGEPTPPTEQPQQ